MECMTSNTLTTTSAELQSATTAGESSAQRGETRKELRGCVIDREGDREKGKEPKELGLS